MEITVDFKRNQKTDNIYQFTIKMNLLKSGLEI